MSKGDRLGRLAAEFFLIVLGVVAALGVDRWVQEIEEDRTERDYLLRLARDVQANDSIFRFMLQDWEASQKAASDLMNVLNDPSSRPPAAGLLAAVARAGATNTGPAQDANFQDLAATGNLRLIRNSDLRVALVHYFGHQIRAGRPSMDRLDLRFRSFAREHLPVEWITEWRVLCPRPTPAFECSATDPPPTDLIWRALTQDPLMPRILNARRNDAAREVAIIQRWVGQSEEMLEKLQAALSAG